MEHLELKILSIQKDILLHVAGNINSYQVTRFYGAFYRLPDGMLVTKLVENLINILLANFDSLRGYANLLIITQLHCRRHRYGGFEGYGVSLRNLDIRSSNGLDPLVLNSLAQQLRDQAIQCLPKQRLPADVPLQHFTGCLPTAKAGHFGPVYQTMIGPLHRALQLIGIRLHFEHYLAVFNSFCRYLHYFLL